ncbi:MAG: hypothetical protein EWV84_15335 [Microcystis sp. M_QC_C_20170808_M3Col]|nr:MAG: hypothetical protein EWV84_15335 [Microcystis sp. M_QC_C_20170808_M3Col]
MFNLANMLLVMIWVKVLAMALKWGDMLKVDPYRYSQECYRESFCIINGYAAPPLMELMLENF